MTNACDNILVVAVAYSHRTYTGIYIFFQASALAQHCGKSVKGKKVRKSVRKFVRLAAKVIGVDFTDPKNGKKRIKFENKLLRLAKAMSGTFKYASRVEHRQRRHLTGGGECDTEYR